MPSWMHLKAMMPDCHRQTAVSFPTLRLMLSRSVFRFA
jgi:hypothetical protein